MKNITDLQAAQEMLTKHYNGSLTAAFNNLIICIQKAESENNLDELKEYERTLNFLRENKDKFSK